MAERPLFEFTYSRVIFRDGILKIQELEWPKPEIWNTKLQISFEPEKAQELFEIALEVAKQITYRKAVQIYGHQSEKKE